MLIPQIDAKDICLSNNNCDLSTPCEGYRTRLPDGEANIRRYRASLDYSLELLKLREVYYNVYRNKRFSFVEGYKEYSDQCISVTFKYSIHEYNRLKANTYVKFGVYYDDVQLDDCIQFKDGQLIAIQVNTPVENPVSEKILGDYFYYEDGQYVAKTNIKSVYTVADLRKMLYENGFYVNGIHYVRFKRSAGSARVGKCLFINEALYSRMHRWELCGLKIRPGDSIDLAAFESYISLTTSSITGLIEIQPKNILLIDDVESVFNDTVVNVREVDGKLQATEEEVAVTNSIWDGQSLIDPSLMGEYSRYGFLLLRNRFFKSAAFNCNIQQFFADRGITDVSQLNGRTLATDIRDILFITTPSSIKYLKFGSFEDWLANIDSLFGVVKHEKPTHYFDGRLVSSHYQLLNTLQMSYEEVSAFLKPTLDYMNLLKTNPAVMRYHVKCGIVGDEDEMSAAASKNEVIYQMLGITDEFTRTQLYYDFRADVLKSYVKNIRCGHVLVNGNYSVLCGNPIEMLLATVDEFDGCGYMFPGTVQSKRFEYGKELLGSRSPHVTMGNVLLTKNKQYHLVDRYMNITEGIVVVNSIGENLLSRLSGADKHHCPLRSAMTV